MIGITMGDGNGVGPEIILKAVKDGKIQGDYIVLGDFSVMDYCNGRLGYGVSLRGIKNLSEKQGDFLNVLDEGLLTKEDITPGKISEKVAAASRAYVVRATKMCLDGSLSAMTTLPVNKEAIRLRDPGFTGHTELIAELCRQDSYTMMLASEKLTVTHVSTHAALEDAIRSVKKERVLEVIELTHNALSRFIKNPRIAVAGLNPHAGEGGAFGTQEKDEIQPAVEEAVARGFLCTGPVAPDTVFLKAARGGFDAVVCMYHDQGHIPMKLLDFDGGVNVSLGLEAVRTSVDHGTAFDIAYQGKAGEHSFVAAYNYALKIQRT